MAYRIELTRSARKDILELNDPVYSRIVKAIDVLEKSPLSSSAKKLKGQEHTWRLRVGDYRILYEIDKQDALITVFRIKHRQDVYR